MSGSGFSINTTGVREFGAQLRGDLDGTLVPESEPITRTFGGGIPFGRRSASAEVQGAAWDYYQQMDQALRLLNNFAHNAEVFIEAVNSVVDAYQHADSLSGQQMRNVIDHAGAVVNAPAVWEQRYENSHGVQ